MAVEADSGRPNQRARTRKDLLEAASRLIKDGRRPSLEEVAEAALVSRATAYRYFPSVEALLVEAPLEGSTPDPHEIFRGASDDPVERLERVDAALSDMIASNETTLRIMLASSLQRGGNGERNGNVPVRQNRRSALIREALEPARNRFTPAAFDTLTKSLALIIGTESMVVFKDVLQIDETDAQRVRRFAIRALVEAAQRTTRQG